MTVRRRWPSRNSEKHPCFLKDPSIRPEGVEPEAHVRGSEHFSGNMESKAAHTASQARFLSPGITASHPRKNAVIL